MSLPRLGVAVALAATATAWVAGCAGGKSADTAPADTLQQSPAPPSPTAGPSGGGPQAPLAEAPRAEKWTALQPGDCLAEAVPTDPAVVSVTVVDCAQPHLAETFLRAPIPVDAALDGTASATCEAGFAQYTGAASAGSPHTLAYLIDSDQDRTDNNPLPSTVICLLQGAQGQSLTGSARR